MPNTEKFVRNMKTFTAVIEVTFVIISVADLTLTQNTDCPKFCAQNYQPVCGSDQNTYGNDCELSSEVDCNDPTLYKLHDGPCSSDSYSESSSEAVTCDDYPCQNGGSCIDYGPFYSCRCPPGYNGVNCQYEGCPFACAAVYEPVCGSDGKTYGNDCELTTQSECYDDSLYKVFDGECSKSSEPVTPPTNPELWCPQKYPDDANASLAQECSRNDDCVPGFGCCWLEDCPNGQCCVELLKEPADCLDGDDSFYGTDLSLRHGEGQHLGDTSCPAYCFCENGRILCAVPSCVATGNTFGTLCRFLAPSLVIIAVIAALCIVKMVRARHRCVGNATPKATGSEVDKPPAYGEVVEVKHPYPSVATVGCNTPPSYEQAVQMA